MVKGRLLRLLLGIDEQELMPTGNCSAIDEAIGALDPFDIVGQMLHQVAILLGKIERSLIGVGSDVRAERDGEQGDGQQSGCHPEGRPLISA